jgi:hypothetical protein
MTHTLRDAQREGMFLFGLATRCWLAVIEAKEALDLRWLLWHLALMAQGSWQEWAEGTKFEDVESPFSPERVGLELRSVRDDVLALKGAVEIIEARYFGMPILFPCDREWLDDLAAKAVELLAAMDKWVPVEDNRGVDGHPRRRGKRPHDPDGPHRTGGPGPDEGGRRQACPCRCHSVREAVDSAHSGTGPQPDGRGKRGD